MKKMTKTQKLCGLVAVFVAVILCLSLLPTQAKATAGENYTVRLAGADGSTMVNARPGDTVTLVLSLENNPGMISVGVELSYPQQLSVAGHTLNTNDMTVMHEQYKFVPRIMTSQTTDANPFLVWMNQATGTTEKKLITYNGSFYEVTFKVADDAAYGDYAITLTSPADKNTTAGVDGNGVIQPNTNTPITDIVAAGCIIHVSDRSSAAGDIDGSGVVDGDDVVQLLLHVTMPDLFPITVEADFTGEGVVDGDDVVQLLLHVTMPDLFPL